MLRLNLQCPGTSLMGLLITGGNTTSSGNVWNCPLESLYFHPELNSLPFMEGSLLKIGVK